MTALLLALALCAAPLPDAAPEAEPEPGGPARYAVAAIEIELYHFGYLAFSNLVTQMPFAEISADSIASHFDGRRGWTFDVDYYDTNQLAHPYQGALYFTCARSAGLPFWTSALFTFAGSLLWELFFEIDAPSVNDQITTSLGGAFLGEMMYRAGLALWNSGLPPFLAVPASFLVDPPGTFNRWLFGVKYDGGASPRWEGRVTAGITLTDRVRTSAGTTSGAPQQPQLALKLTYRDHGDQPFSWFDVDARLAPSPIPLTVLFLRGMLYGRGFSAARGALTGSWGVVGAYDFTSTPIELRASIVGVGFGAALDWRFSQSGYLRAVSTNELVPYGSIGSLGLDPDYHRDYHIGLGYSGAVSLELGHVAAGALYASFRQWMIGGVYTRASGYELLTRVELGVVARLGGPFVAGVEWISVWRLPYFDDGWYDRAIDGELARVWVGASLGELP